MTLRSLSIAGFAALLAVPVSLAAQQPVAPATSQSSEVEKADALQEQAEELASGRKFDEALAAATESLAIRERVQGAEHADTAGSLNALGFVHFMRGDLAAAEPPFTRALQIRRTARGVEDTELAESLNNLAALYQAQGRLRDAEPLLVESLGLYEKAKAPADLLGAAYNNLGGLLYQRGDYARARQHFTRASEFWKSAYPAGDPRLGVIANNLGLVSQGLGDYLDAERNYRESVGLREKAGETVDLARTLNNLASALQEQGRLDESAPLYTRALAVYEKLGAAESPGAGQALNNLAVLRLLQKDYESARPLYERALAIREKALGPDHPDTATSLQAYAIFLNNTGRVDEAINTQARATDIIEKNVALVLEVGAEAQKERFLQMFSDSVDVTLWLRSRASTAAADRTALMTVLRRKGRVQEVLAESSDALRAAHEGSAPAELDELSRSRASLARLVLQAPGAAASRERAIRDLQEKIDQLEARVSQRTADRAAERALTAEAVQAAIPADAVLVEFFRYRPFDPTATRLADRFGPARYAAYGLGRTGGGRWVELGDAAPVDAAIASFRGALVNPGREDVRERAAALLPLVTEPLMRLAGEATHVILAPDGDLNLLPFQALVGPDRRFLVERYQFGYVTGGRELAANPPSIAPGAPVIVANPDFGRTAAGGGAVSRSFAPLPGADAEAADVAALLPGARILRGEAASEANVKAVRHPSVLHIATHGFFLSGSAQDAIAGTRGLRRVSTNASMTIPPLLRSGLALAGANASGGDDAEDGVLTASEAATLDLRGTGLVFLSACESGLGVTNAGESVYGLRRAFVIAGAKSQVLTLWQVSDQATRTFVGDFYRRLRAGETRGAALRAAQQAALADPSRTHPFYWAAFIFSGADGVLRTPATQH